MSFWDRLERVAADWNVLDHRFYVRWTRGELLREELARYSGQYRHAVVALAGASAAAAAGADGEARELVAQQLAARPAHVEAVLEHVPVRGDPLESIPEAHPRSPRPTAKRRIVTSSA